MRLIGKAASKGVVKGTARVVTTLEEIDKFESGEILVTIATSPAWTPFIHAAGGVVTERGGVLSHAAIVSREYGIPAVVAIKDAIKKIKDGQKIKIDGTKGIIDIG